MPQPLHQISWLEHIRCYPKSTLPLSEDCALAILLTEYYSDHPASVLVLMLGLSYPPSSALLPPVLLPMVLPLPLLHLYDNSLCIRTRGSSHFILAGAPLAGRDRLKKSWLLPCEMGVAKEVIVTSPPAKRVLRTGQRLLSAGLKDAWLPPCKL